MQSSVIPVWYGNKVKDPEVTVDLELAHIRIAGHMSGPNSSRSCTNLGDFVRYEVGPATAGQGLSHRTAVVPTSLPLGFRPDTDSPVSTSLPLGFRPDTDSPVSPSLPIRFRPDTESPVSPSPPVELGSELASSGSGVGASPYALAVGNLLVGSMGLARKVRRSPCKG